MLEGHEKAIYRDMSAARNDVGFEVHWNQGTDDTVRITIGDKSAVIPYASLYGFVFINSEGEDMNNLMPVKQTVVKHLRKQHRVTVQRNIKRGEQLVVNCEIDIPVAIIQALKGDLGKIPIDISPSKIQVPI